MVYGHMPTAMNNRATPPPPPSPHTGAIYASSVSSIHVDGNTSFAANVAQDDGGVFNVRPPKVPTIILRLGFL